MNETHSVQHYALQILLPAFEEYIESLRDRVAGGQSAIVALGKVSGACLHMADHLARDPQCSTTIPGAPRSKTYIKDFAARSEWFRITRDIANAYKHRAITDENKTIEGINSLDEYWAIVAYEDESGRYFDVRTAVYVKLNDAREFLAEYVIDRCIQDWFLELQRIGIFSSLPHISARSCEFVPRSLVPPRLSLKIIGDVGLYMSVKRLLLRHEPLLPDLVPLQGAVGRLEVDLTFFIRPSQFAPKGSTQVTTTTMVIQDNPQSAAANEG